MRIEISSGSADFTRRLGKDFSSVLLPGDLIMLSGDLGGGKTTFISGLAKGLGIKEDITSPSFTLINEYRYRQGRFVHADLYRLEGLQDISDIGMDDYLYDENSIVCIEWGNKLGGTLAKDHLNIDFAYEWDVENKRKIVFNSKNKYWDLKLERFEEII